MNLQARMWPIVCGLACGLLPSCTHTAGTLGDANPACPAGAACAQANGPRPGTSGGPGRPPAGKQWWKVDNCAGMPPGAIPAPIGTHVHAWTDAQAASAEADDFVIYKHEWYMGGLELGPYGHYHLHQIARRLLSVPFPVVVQPDKDPATTETRRQLIVAYLAHAGIPDADQRVIIAYPQAEGLTGGDAVRTYNMLVAEEFSNTGTFGFGAGNTLSGFQRGGFGGFGGFGRGLGGGGLGGFGYGFGGR